MYHHSLKHHKVVLFEFYYQTTLAAACRKKNTAKIEAVSCFIKLFHQYLKQRPCLHVNNK